MYYAFDLRDTKEIDEFTVDNISKITLVSFNTLKELEKFIDSNYSYIYVYDHNSKFPEAINFDNKLDAQLELISCLNNID